MIADSDPRAVALVAVIRRGDLVGLAALLEAHPGLAGARFGTAASSRAALHLATDWPGRCPAVGRTIAALVAAGAGVDERFVGPHRETPLHWAASADDVEAIDALLDAGADIEADGAVLTGGTPLADAVVFAQWAASRRLVARGASMTLWQAAALGELDEVLARLDRDAPTVDERTNACWHACRAGQLAAVRTLVGHGARLDRVGHDDMTARQAGESSGDPDLVAWLGACAHDDDR